MAGKGTVNTGDGFAETCSSIISGVITFFLMILVTMFPLVYHNSYFDILETKYRCFYMCVLGMAVIVLILALIMMVVDMNEFKGEHTRTLFSKLIPANWKTTFSLADCAVILFWLVCVISTLQSEYLFEAFWGNEGRYSGLFLITVYVLAYFLISRCWKVKGWILELFLITGMIICYIGITDYFQMDILNFRGEIKPDQSTMFTSTLGNINTYTAYVGIVMGFSAAMFATSKKLWKSIWYYMCTMVSFMAIIMGCSDNAYLAIGALFAFLPYVLFDTRKGILRYFLMLAGFVSVIQCIDIINQRYADVVIGLDSLFQILVNFNGLMYVMCGLWIAALLFYVLVCRGESSRIGSVGTDVGNKQGGDTEMNRRWIYIWSIFIALCIVAVCAALFDANALGHGARYGGIGRYLVFNDTWGTNRGYIWRKSMELYQGFPTLHKLFGYGPDTFGIMTTQEFRAEMVNATGQVFDSAHNEYIQFLLTVGPIGLLAYVTFQIASCWRMTMYRLRNPYVVGCACAVLCYGLQAFVNLNLPIATPMMWLLLSIGTAALRSGNES